MSESTDKPDLDEVPNTNDGDDLEVADPNDFFITRSDGENPDPVKQRIPGTDDALRIVPLTNAKLEAWGDELESDDPDEETVADVFNYALADLDRTLTADDIDRNMIGYGVAPLMQAVKNASGYQAFLGYQEQRMRMIGMIDQIGQADVDLQEIVNLAEENNVPSDGTS